MQPSFHVPISTTLDVYTDTHSNSRHRRICESQACRLVESFAFMNFQGDLPVANTRSDTVRPILSLLMLVTRILLGQSSHLSRYRRWPQVHGTLDGQCLIQQSSSNRHGHRYLPVNCSTIMLSTSNSSPSLLCSLSTCSGLLHIRSWVA